ncbi:transthyretin domain containing protein [Pyrenophora tritici-repentis Pt-1C-BFP]|uniref:Transthyretin domain containing protein n=1 Tax=Pyrenophora tritici-repentis (strain Pt-1C-BFP) TaxID=426418 RepID=B2VVZ7_PYRTR|nr:transthyretin domain containing protein [Pyrenophora tritici-repentis Pt-1C-BFP]EDU40797.1 transthyretin domain containing protein [Pyrenophora tritici-repentis Pt-1C-BFP]
MSTPTPKPPITCHILDTTLGRPAPSIPVTLTLHNPSSQSTPSSTTTPLKFTATTNTDGRVTAWTPATPFSTLSLQDVYTAQAGDARFSLTFDTGAYFEQRGIDAFFPEVVCRAESFEYCTVGGLFVGPGRDIWGKGELGDA